MLARMRIWLPDVPGVLGAVAAEIGAVDGNVVGLEVLEREAGVAIDEFVVGLPDVIGAVDAVCKGIRNIPGAGVEEVGVLGGAVQDREDAVLNAAAAILQAATPTAAMNALSGQLISLFDLTWLAVADLGTESFVEVHGEVPTIAWVAAFATGSQTGPTPPTTPPTRASSSKRARNGTHRLRGKAGADPRRQRRGISMLVVVTGRFVDALGGANTPTDRGGFRRAQRGRRPPSVGSCCGSGLSGRA